VEADWSRAEAQVTQREHLATISLAGDGDGDLQAAADQVLRFLSLDVDARGWPDVARRDPVIADAQAQLPGLRPCGFHSPYEAAAWWVLSQRIRIVQAARLRRDLVDRRGEGGAFPAPRVLRALDLDLPGRKTEYLHAVADAALDGRLDGTALRAVDPDDAVRSVQEIKGWGRSRPSWWYCGAPTLPTSCPAAKAAWTLRSSSVTARTGHWPRFPRPGVPTARGRQSTSAHCASNAPTRSADRTATDIAYVRHQLNRL